MGHLFGTRKMISTFIYRREDVSEAIIVIGGPEAHHISKVLRLGRGDMVRMIDGQGTAHVCEIAAVDSKKISCRIIKTLKNSGESSLYLTLAIGLSTATKFDIVVEKATEAGVSRLVPLLTEKGRVKTGDKGAVTRKMQRWRRICEAAVKQSGRSRIPHIDEPILLPEFLAGCDPAETVIFHPTDREDNIADAIKLSSVQKLTILVGPESGFSAGEIEVARSRGMTAISLGDRILRTETAGTVLPALMIYLWEKAKA